MEKRIETTNYYNGLYRGNYKDPFLHSELSKGVFVAAGRG